MDTSENILSDRVSGAPISIEGTPSSIGIIDLSLKTAPQTTLSKVATGTTLYSIFNWLYDYPLYSIVLWYGGILWGGLFMALISIPVDLVTLKFYDWSQEDWFAIEYLKSMKNYRGRNPLKRFLGYVLRETPLPIQVMALATKFNAFVVTTLLREGAYEYKGLSRRDWFVFWGTYFSGQLYWIMVIGTGLEVGNSIATYVKG